MNTQTQVENEARREIISIRAVDIYAYQKKPLDKAADELIAQLSVRGIDIHKSTVILCLANAIAVYKIEGG